MSVARGTLADVATHAGVSVPTVSKVVNGRSDVSPTTRARVMDAIEAVGYVSLLRRAGRGSSGILELLTEGMDSPWSLEIVQGVEAEATRRGAGLVITSSVGALFSLEGWVDALRARRSSGVVAVLPTRGVGLLQGVGPLPLPVVLIDSEDDPAGTVPLVRATDWEGARSATARLVGLGHRRIGHLAGPPGLRNAHARREGWAAALRAAGLDPADELVVPTAYELTAGEGGAGALLDLRERPTAVFCASDAQAAGLYAAARERGLRIPDDVSVIGFDDTVVSQHLSPSLSTVHQDLRAMGAEAVRIASTLAADPDAPIARRIEVATRLVERRSTAPLAL